MLVPESWLREYVPDAPAPAEVEQRLLVTGTAVDRVEHVGVPERALTHYRVGRIVSYAKHPDADKLNVCQVDVGEGEPRQIVCGAPNVAAASETTVAVVLPGGELPDGAKIGEAKLRGVASAGMLLSERELGLSNDHSGIIVGGADWTPGAPLADVIPLSDTVFDLEITSNRPDCLAVLGVAREVAAAFDVELAEPGIGEQIADASGSIDDIVSVTVSDPDLCPRYMARAFTNVTVGPSPGFVKARLARAGMRSINNVVDVTNFVMLALGQPLHAFDADSVVGRTLSIRRADEGEQVVTLDDVARTLTRDDLVIADGSGPAVIAGIMGAAHVEVTNATTSLVLESANFAGPSVMATSARLGLRSESSTRFEKGLHPELCEYALDLATHLLVTHCGAQLVSGTIDERGRWADRPDIELARTQIPRILGIEIEDGEVERILAALGFGTAPTDMGWRVSIPYWRAGDVSRSIDVIEEIGRVHGYDMVPFTLPERRAVGRGLTPVQRTRRLLEDAAVGLGLHQTVTYSLVSPADNDEFGAGSASAVRTSHPMSVDQAQLRQSLTGSLLDVVRRNLAAGQRDVALFESTAVFATGGGTDEHGHPIYARQRDVLGFAATGSLGGQTFEHRHGIEADFAAASGIVAALARAAGTTATVVPFDDDDTPADLHPTHAARVELSGDTPAYLHPIRAARIVLGDGTPAGWIGELHPHVAERYDIRHAAVIGELDVAAFVPFAGRVRRFEAFGNLPPVRQDIALILANGVRAADVLTAARDASDDLLESVTIFDRHTGSGIPDGHYSLALRLVFRADDRTLTSDEVTPERERIVAALEQQFGATLRG